MLWHSKKQQLVAHSTIEAEFRALAHGLCEGWCLKRLLIDLRVEVEGPIDSYCYYKGPDLS